MDMKGTIILNQDRVFFEEPYGVLYKQSSGDIVRISDYNWINSLILFFIYSNAKKNDPTTVNDVVDFFDKSQIFYLQKNPVPKRADVEGIVLELVQALARNEYVVIKE